jgi:galactonate dehydratase
MRQPGDPAVTLSLVSRIRLEIVQPVDKTRWQFLTVETTDGLSGIGEATWQKDEDGVFARAAELLPALVGAPAEPGLVARIGPVPDIAGAAVLSALSHALWDIAGKRAGQPVAALLGRPLRNEIALYANINRRTVSRTPQAFAESARLAMAAGFEAFKLAPFDEVDAAARKAGADAARIGPGLARVAAVREAIGPDRDLMVDCHWRFSIPGAKAALEALEPFGLYWYECPIPETDATIPEIVRLRKLANAAGMRLAGCETGVGVAGFEPFVAARAYDAIMPDIKYVGSMEEMLALAVRLEGTGTGFSPHNPSGPVSHAASLHLCALAPGFTRLEMQFDETDLFWTLAANTLPRPRSGTSALPGAPGLGITLDPNILAALRQRSVAF